MIANNRSCNCMSATISAFRVHSLSTHLAEQQSGLWAAGLTPVGQALWVTQPIPSDPGLAPVGHAK